jgi:PhnB protein
MAARRAKSGKSTSARKTARKVAPKKKKVAAVPAKYGSATPTLIVSPCTQAIAYYQQAFGARLLSSMPGPGGSVMHAELKIGDSVIMVSDEQPPMNGEPSRRKAPRSLGGTTGGVMLYVKDADAVFAAAVKAGGKTIMPPADMFWGDRYAVVEDPFGQVWDIATHLRDVTPKAMQAAMASMMGPPPA